MDHTADPDDPRQLRQAEIEKIGQMEETSVGQVIGGIVQERKQRRQQKMAMKICAVCSDKAIGYNFDAVTCESCKAFFRRNALKDEDYHRCSFNNNCEINTVSRRFCQKCRLLKCFRVGMKKEWIETEEKLLQRKRKRIEKNRRKSSCPESTAQAATISSGRCSVTSTDTISGSNTSSGSRSGSISECCSDGRMQPMKTKISPLPADLTKRIRLVPNSNFENVTSVSPIIQRETVIKLGSSSAPASAPCERPCASFVWPPTIIDHFRPISVPATVLAQLVSICQFSCRQAQIPLPPAVEYACGLLWPRQTPSMMQQDLEGKK